MSKATDKRPGQISLADARKGNVQDVDAQVAALRERWSGQIKVRDSLLYDTALNFLAVVMVGKSLSAKDFTESIGRSKSSGSLYKRLATCADRFGVRPGSALWTFLADAQCVGAVSAALKIEDDAEAEVALKNVFAEYREHGRVTGDARTPNRQGGTGGSDETPDETPAPQPATLSDVLDALDTMVREIPNDESGHAVWVKVRDRVRAIDTRESHLRRKVDAKIRAAAKVDESAAATA